MSVLPPREPQPASTIVAAFASTVARHGDLEAIVDGAHRLDYSTLDAHARAFARGLVACDVQRGDRVAIWASNSWRWVAAALGVWMAGGVVVPVSTRYRGTEASHLLTRSRAAVLVVENGFLGNDYLGMLNGAHVASTVIDLAFEETPDETHPVPGTISWARLLERGQQVSEALVRERAAAVQPDDLADLIFTSGTTGRPKGAMLRHGQLVRLYETWASVVGLAAGDRNLVVLPLFHTAGHCSGMLASLLTGATAVLQPVFAAATSLRLIRDERVSVLNGPPTLFVELLDHPDRTPADLATLRVAITGSTTVPEVMVERLRTELVDGVVLTAYGLTESCGTVTMCMRDDDVRTIATRCGAAVPGVEVEIRDATGGPLTPGQEGEVTVRGYNVFAGYFDDPAATAAAVDAAGWLRTGDLGRLDERGYLTLTGRLTDVFVVGGFNAYPAEIEQTLTRHPAVLEAAVVGVPDARLGEVGRAFVILRPGAHATETDLLGWCREHLANFKVPRAVVLCEDFPRGATGKVAKHELVRT